MPPVLLKVVAVFLLVVQAGLSLASGRVLCVGAHDCGSHVHLSDVGVGHSHDEHGGHHEDHDCGDPAEGGYAIVGAAMHDGWGCHVHVPVPDNEQGPRSPRGDAQALRAIFVPRVAALVIAWDVGAVREVPTCSRPPDLSGSDQVCGLKATRLII
jgi:hypothetical protein